jgi:dihydrolipoamide dehydrogenase
VRLGIIGGGPGGYSAALRASLKAIDTTIFEKEEIGGICLNTGCIPTKTLVSYANLLNLISKSKRFGLNVSVKNLDWKRIQESKDNAKRRLVIGVSNLLNNRGVKIIKEKADLVDNFLIETESKRYEFDRIIIATGSKPKKAPFTVPADVWDSRDAVNSKDIPRSLSIIGAGVIGLEFAHIYSSFGSNISIVELENEVMPGEDEDLSSILRKTFEKRKIRFYLSSTVKEVIKNDRFITKFIYKGKEKVIESDRVLLSIGRIPFIKDFEGILEFERGAIKVDKYLRSSKENIYAIGDCIGGRLLAHCAYKEAEIAVRNILGEDVEINERVIPRVVYTNPEFASVGFTEDELKKDNIYYKVSKYPFSGNPRAIASNETVGEVKLIYNKKGEILGCGIVSNEASELISILSLAMEYNININKLSEFVFPHPTLSEAIKETAAIADGNPIH